jgi:hypothetical protein
MTVVSMSLNQVASSGAGTRANQRAFSAADQRADDCPCRTSDECPLGSAVVMAAVVMP